MFRSLLLVLFFLYNVHEIRFPHTASAEMVPMGGQGKTEIMVMMNDMNMRKLDIFQVCSKCTCCEAGNRKHCLLSPCCFFINCNIPNRPFGFCSFTPKTCSCNNGCPPAHTY
ncbi:hypothetical protein ACJIZ3_023149 [Penstemon smallii]|uniref:DUF7866 domain-containing protein n=1 Tax=Penstemon smallii TaxID=265156 RepID=A0ABD3TQN4_9LAMI